MKRSRRNNGCGDEETTQVSAMLVRPESDSDLNNKEEDKKHKTRKLRDFRKTLIVLAARAPDSRTNISVLHHSGNPQVQEGKPNYLGENQQIFVEECCMNVKSKSALTGEWKGAFTQPEKSRRFTWRKTDIWEGASHRTCPWGYFTEDTVWQKWIGKKIYILSLKDWRKAQNPRDTCAR